MVGAAALHYLAFRPQYAHTNSTTGQAITLTAAQPSAAQQRAELGQLPDLATAAQSGTRSVVFIQTLSQGQRGRDEFWSFWDFFGNQGPISSAGSGVIISGDGYLVTNNHVIEGADKITVSLANKHSYPARVIGTDPNTDLALLKIEAQSLTPIALANSDDVRIGDWALAVGNPFNLTYTVTAGIISAKGRNINIVNTSFPIESFIQTDAAINPGNSGGALLNTTGQLIGINTAIASRTGAYNGYGFAIPANIVKKVAEDLRQYGEVQRAFAGMDVIDISSDLAEQLNSDDYTGVLVQSLEADGPAAKSGLKVGDVVLAVNGYPVNAKAEFLERLSYQRPGDVVKIGYRRNGIAATQEVTLMLVNLEGTLEKLKSRTYTSEKLGAVLEPLSRAERAKLGVESGVKIKEVRSGLLARLGLPKNATITRVNGKAITTPQQLEETLLGAQGRLTLELVGADGSRGTYGFYVR